MSKLLLLILFISNLSAQQLFTEDFLKQVSNLRDKALTDSTAYDITESLTTEVGPRLAGSNGDTLAVKWGVNKFKELGFDKVYTEPATFRRWTRGIETAQIVSPYPHDVKITALGSTFCIHR